MMKSSMTREQFQAEKNYLAAREIALRLLKQSALTDREFVQIDTILREKFSPKIGALLAEFSCNSVKDAA